MKPGKISLEASAGVGQADVLQGLDDDHAVPAVMIAQPERVALSSGMRLPRLTERLSAIIPGEVVTGGVIQHPSEGE